MANHQDFMLAVQDVTEALDMRGAPCVRTAEYDDSIAYSWNRLITREPAELETVEVLLVPINVGWMRIVVAYSANFAGHVKIGTGRMMGVYDLQKMHSVDVNRAVAKFLEATIPEAWKLVGELRRDIIRES